MNCCKALAGSSPRCRICIYAFLVAIVIAVFLFTCNLTSEPVYRERKLTFWLRQLGRPDPTPDASQAAADESNAREALRSLGTNSTPFLIDLFCTRPYNVKLGI